MANKTKQITTLSMDSHHRQKQILPIVFCNICRLTVETSFIYLRKHMARQIKCYY